MKLIKFTSSEITSHRDDFGRIIRGLVDVTKDVTLSETKDEMLVSLYECGECYISMDLLFFVGYDKIIHILRSTYGHIAYGTRTRVEWTDSFNDIVRLETIQ